MRNLEGGKKHKVYEANYEKNLISLRHISAYFASQLSRYISFIVLDAKKAK